MKKDGDAQLSTPWTTSNRQFCIQAAKSSGSRLIFVVSPQQGITNPITGCVLWWIVWHLVDPCGSFLLLSMKGIETCNVGL